MSHTHSSVSRFCPHAFDPAIFVAPSTPDGVAGLEGRLLYRDDLADKRSWLDW